MEVALLAITLNKRAEREKTKHHSSLIYRSECGSIPCTNRASPMRLKYTQSVEMLNGNPGGVSLFNRHSLCNAI